MLRSLSKFNQLYPKDLPVLITAAATGMRIGEVIAITREDILDSIACPVFLVRRTYCRATKTFKNSTKGGRARTAPLSDQLLAILKPLYAQKKA